MKKFNLFSIPALIFASLFAVNAVAQTSVAASAEVLADVTVQEQQAVSFGFIEQDITTNTPTLDPEAASGTNTNGTVQLGYIYFTGSASTPVSITNGTATLANGSNSDYQVTYTPTLCYDNSDNRSNGSCSATAVSNGADVSVASFSGAGTVWLGGTLTAPSSDGGSTSTETALLAGTYSGNVSITIAYNF